MKTGFASTMRKGFHMTFNNGLTVSVQWGAGNYCDNHFPEDMDFSFSKDAKSSTAEIAVFNGGIWLNPCDFANHEIGGDGMVSGYLSPEDVADILFNTANMTEDKIEEITAEAKNWDWNRR